MSLRTPAHHAHADPYVPITTFTTLRSVTQIPFNDLLRIEECPEETEMLRLRSRESLQNHVGTLHAGALMTLAEAASAQYLLRRLGLPQHVVPLLRRFEAKFCRPANGEITASAHAAGEALIQFRRDTETRGWGLIGVDVELHDQARQQVLTARTTWFAKLLR